MATTATTTPAPDPKTNGRRDIFDTISDEELDRMFETTIGQRYLMQDHLEHGLEAAHVWG